MNKRFLFALLSVFAMLGLFAPAAQEPKSVWETAGGDTIEGRWDAQQDISEDKITLVMPSGKTLSFFLDQLCDEDRVYVQKERKRIGWNPKPDPGANNIYALLVGVTDYLDYQPLKYAVNDMNLIQEQLIDMHVPSANIRILISGGTLKTAPTKENIERELDRLLGSSDRSDSPDSSRTVPATEPLAKKGDLVFIALAGHGTQTPSGAYFMPADASPDRNRIEETSISIEGLQERISESEATFKWLLVDACRSEPPTLAEHIGERDSADYALTKLQTIQNPPPGMVTMQSCSVSESSWESEKTEHGIFSATFVEGLKGNADKNHDGAITMTELISFLTDETHSRVWNELQKTQTPYIRSEQSDFVIVDNILIGGHTQEEWRTANGYYQEARELCVEEKYEEAKEKIDAALAIIPEELPENQEYFELAQMIVKLLDRPPVIDTGDTEPGEVLSLTNDGVEYRFRWCPPGEFDMGSPDWEKGHENDEQLHHVRLTKGFWLLETEVTQKMWMSVLGKNEVKYRIDYQMGAGLDCPVYNVSWEECREFCQKLGKFLGQTITLPTEAQWEYACRAGSVGEYAGTGKLIDMGWNSYSEHERIRKESFSNQQSRTEMQSSTQPLGLFGARPSQPSDPFAAMRNFQNEQRASEERAKEFEKVQSVGGKMPNGWGLYDMHGNVSEWCADKYSPDYYSDSPQDDPQGPEYGAFRVYRGGGLISLWESSRSASRSHASSTYISSNIGFRVALIPVPAR